MKGCELVAKNTAADAAIAPDTVCIASEASSVYLNATCVRTRGTLAPAADLALQGSVTSFGAISSER